MSDYQRLLTEEDLIELERAYRCLENPSLAAKIVDRLGTPIERGLALLPSNWHQEISKISEMALRRASDAALLTLHDTPRRPPTNRLHKAAVALSGGVGGFFGLPALSIELPISTTIMLRSIIEIARGQGESISHPDTQAACLAVFALGSTRNRSDDAAETGYYSLRIALASGISNAPGLLAKSGSTAQPLLLATVSRVAERFGIAVTDKAIAQLVPALGAASGAAVNTLFIDHFQSMANGHFTIRRLERKYGKELVQEAYESLLSRQ